jgi:hypothetical protein
MTRKSISTIFLGAALIGLAPAPAMAQQARVSTVDQGKPGALPWLTQLVPGSALIGKLGIDQTSPGSTNGVAQNDPIRTVTGTLSAQGQTLVVDTAGGNAVAVFAGATGSTVTFQDSDDGTTNLLGVVTYDEANGLSFTPSSATGGGNRNVIVPVGRRYLVISASSYGGTPIPVVATVRTRSAVAPHTYVVNPVTAVTTTETGSAASSAGITPAVAQSATALVGKAAAGNLYGYAVTNLSATAGFVALVNASAAPASGATITPLECRPLAANGLTEKSYIPGPPPNFSAGVVVLVTTSCATYTPGGSSFIQAMVR